MPNWCENDLTVTGKPEDIEAFRAEWNAADVKFADSSSPKKLVIHFSTAWSLPRPVIEAMAAKHPKLKFTLKYYEGGMGFKGVIKCENGEVVDDHDEHYRGRRGG